MIFRFCLYGFLKNQRYFAPFWILAFVDKGLSFATIGSLIGFQQICVTVGEVPTGALADALGRRQAMILSHIAYVIAFLTFAFANSVPLLFAAMFAFAIGEAFRTGTHKAMIFAWLKQEGRESEKTEIYGLTRSWSQKGSALSALIAAGLVFTTLNYSTIFWLSVIPTSLNIVNFLGYPKSLDGISGRPRDTKTLFGIFWSSICECVRKSQLRKPISESMGFEGVYGATKDYLQPVIQQLVVGVPLFVALSETRRTAVAVAIIYTTLYLLSSFASRRAGRIAKWLGGDLAAARSLWLVFLATMLMLLLGTLAQWQLVSVLAFIALAILQNIWRPVLVSRIADQVDQSNMATVLSVESQAKSLGIALLAPVIGYFIDRAPEDYQFSVIAIVGIVVSAIAIACTSKKRHEAAVARDHENGIGE
ncbi:MFS transporter [Stieleria sp. JC731]|uniref:MFS transporter n=1 Tax=Pirellulaceae TaxID=2691357 RepID=UPI001E308872|nr:MFS transporter [Stieleria sp. JC731]MCC9601297.1 MFS transporter [Stieleria sp. JC731]